VTLTATPGDGSTFVGWSPAPCAASFVMSASDLTCTATFVANKSGGNTGTSTYVPPPPPPETNVIVSFGGTGQGKVASNPTGIDCQSPYGCSYTFQTDTAIQLTPQATGPSRFQNWGNSCNDGIISASGKTVYCTVYFVDTTPPAVEPTPVDVPVDNQTSTDTLVDNPTPIDVPVDNQTSTDMSVDVSTDNQIPPPVDDPEELPVVEEPVDVTPEPETVISPEETMLPPLVSDEPCPPKDTLSYYCNAGGQTVGNLIIIENPGSEYGVGFL